MMVKKICVITGTRAEFGLLLPLIMELKKDESFELQILATGMHLSPEFGNTYKNIEEEGITIDEKVEMLLSADTDTAIVKSTGLGMIGYADALNRLAPDFIVLLGDRFEAFAAAAAAYLKKIPIIHLHGGEVTAGATDEGLRHSITKMSAIHFTSTEEHRRRVMQLGEADDMVFNVGAIGLDNIYEMPLMTKQELEASLNLSLEKPIALITYHPVTLESKSSEQQMEELLAALGEIENIMLIFTMPNADADGRILIQMIHDYVQRNPEKSAAFTSLGQLRYLSLMKATTLVLGNSSSGLLEAPSFGIPTVNIGDRQKGRISAASVLHCTSDKDAIIKTIKAALDPAFREFCQKVENPYGIGGVAKKIIAILKNKASSNINLKKEFIDRL